MDKQRKPAKRTRTSRRIHADWRYRALDREGRFFEDTVSGDVIEHLSQEEAEIMKHYLTLRTFQVKWMPERPMLYFPEHDVHLMGGAGCLCN